MAGVVRIVLFDVWLIADQEVIAGDSLYDDHWFLVKARVVYWFDEGYSNISFLKEPIFPLFAGACYRLGLPLRLAVEAFYLASTVFFVWCLVLRQSNAVVGLLVFAACAFQPMHYNVLLRTTYDEIYSSLLLLVL